MFFLVHEVKDRTLEEIDQTFEKRVPAWQFEKYVCVGTSDARLAGLIEEQPNEEKYASCQ